MYFSTQHWAHLVNGYSGTFPTEYESLRRHLDPIPTDDAVDLLVATRVTAITVNCEFYRSPGLCQTVRARLERDRRVSLAAMGEWAGAPVFLYRLTRR
jgi:hypothetical protein